MSKFSPGDTVICIFKDKDGYLINDKSYTVKQVYNGLVVLKNVYGEWFEDRFSKKVSCPENLGTSTGSGSCSVGPRTYALSLSIGNPNDPDGNSIVRFDIESITVENAQEVIAKILAGLA